MDFNWTFLIDVGIIAIALLIATLLRARVTFFQRFLIPNALTAGFILLFVYNFLVPRLGHSGDGLGDIVYHLMSISFVSMTLRRSEAVRAKGSHGIIGTSVAVLFQYGAQGLFGLLLTALLIATAIPDLFPSFGLFVPLGFALGPGQAFAIGRGWEPFGFFGAGSVGLTFAAIGFLIACFAGVYLLNYGYRHGWLGADKDTRRENADSLTGVFRRGEELPTGSKLTTYSEAIDSMSINFGMVLAVYLLSYLGLRLLTYLLSFAGELGTDLAVNLWAINFVFATITALGVKRLLSVFRVDHVLDSGALARISGTSVDILVSAAIGAISLVVVGRYWGPIVIISLVTGVFVFFSVPWIASRLFKDYRFHRTVIIFGAMTGTLPTGLALLRVVDPDFETPVAGDYVYSSAVVFVFAIPLILSINLPAYSVTRGKPFLFWLTVIIIAVYVIISVVAYFIIARRRALIRPTKLWNRGGNE